MVKYSFLLSVSSMSGITILARALPDAEENTILIKAHLTTWMKTCSLRMPWIPFGKFILASCQLSLIFVKAVRLCHWFRRLTLIQFMEWESSCFSQITEVYRMVSQPGAFRVLLGLKEGCAFSRELQEGSLGWANWRTWNWRTMPCFQRATDFWHCAKAMCIINMKKSWWPISKAPVKRPGWKQERSSIPIILHTQTTEQEKAREQRCYRTSSPTPASNSVTALAGQWSMAPGYIWLNNECSPPPWEDAHLEISTNPLICMWFPLERGHELCSIREGAGAGRPMLWECEDCGVCMVLEGERLKYGLARADWEDTAYWKTCFCPRVCRRDTAHGVWGEEGAIGDSQGGCSSSGAWRWQQPLLNTSFLPVSDFPRNGPQPLLQLTSKNYQPATGSRSSSIPAQQNL